MFLIWKGGQCNHLLLKIHTTSFINRFIHKIDNGNFDWLTESSLIVTVLFEPRVIVHLTGRRRKRS